MKNIDLLLKIPIYGGLVMVGTIDKTALYKKAFSVEILDHHGFFPYTVPHFFFITIIFSFTLKNELLRQKRFSWFF